MTLALGSDLWSGPFFMGGHGRRSIAPTASGRYIKNLQPFLHYVKFSDSKDRTHSRKGLRLMSSRPTTHKLQVTVARLLELSYARNEGLTASIIREVGPAKISVRSDGSATLSGKAGVVTFSASDAIEEIGITVSRIGVSLSIREDGQLDYSARFFTGALALSANGTIDVEQLILACSGILCRAARALKQRTRSVEAELEGALR